MEDREGVPDSWQSRIKCLRREDLAISEEPEDQFI